MDIKKTLKALPTGFAEEAAKMSVLELREMVVASEQQLSDLKVNMAADGKLAGAKEIVKDLMAGYNGVKKAHQAKIAYALHLMKEAAILGSHGTGTPTEVDSPSESPI